LAERGIILYSVSIHLILLILSALFAAFILIFAKVSAPYTHTDNTKLSNYECGNKDEIDAKIKIKANFITFAILFLVYVSECFLLFPFSLALGKLKSFVFLQAIIFILVMILSLSYALRKNLLRFR